MTKGVSHLQHYIHVDFLGENRGVLIYRLGQGGSPAAYRRSLNKNRGMLIYSNRSKGGHLQHVVGAAVGKDVSVSESRDDWFSRLQKCSGLGEGSELVGKCERGW